MANVSKEDLAKLLKAGYTISDLTKIARSDPAQVQRLVQQSKVGPLPQVSPGNFWQQYLSGRDPYNRSNNFQSPASKGSTLFNSLSGSGLAQAAKKLPGALAEIYQKATSGGGRNPNASQAIMRAADAANRLRRLVAAAQQSGVTEEPGYEAPSYMPPSLEMRDFTEQSRQQVGGIYAPRYQAIDAAAQAAAQAYQRDDKVTAGLYENLAKQVSQITNETNARYAQAGQNQATATQNLSNQIGQNYSSTQQQEADMLRQLGQEEAAKQVLGDNSAEQAYQQSQAQQSGALQQANIAQQGNVQADYLQNVSNAQQTGGVRARQDLIERLAAENQALNQNRFALQGDEAEAALQLSQRLSDRDLQLQQAQLGQYNDAYQINAGNSRQAYEDRVGNQRFAYEQEMERQAAARDQANKDRQFELDQAKYGTDLATAAAQLRLEQQKLDQGNQPQGLDINDQDPASRTIAQIANATGDEGSAQGYFQFVNQATSAIAASGEDPALITGNMFQFVDYVGRAAQAKGLNVQTAQRAAAAYWQNFWSRK